MHRIQTLIDKASKVCGSQNALAAHLGIESGNLSRAKHGKRPFTREQIEALSVLVNEDAGDVWELQEIANMARRNPFRTTFSDALLVFLRDPVQTLKNRARRREDQASTLNDHAG